MGNRTRPMPLRLRITIASLIAALSLNVAGCSGVRETIEKVQTRLFPWSRPSADSSQGTNETDETVARLFDRQAFQEKVEELHARYTSTLTDIVAFQEDPDYQKAEEKRQQLVSEANTLAAGYQDLANRLELKMGKPGQGKAGGDPGAPGIDVTNKKAFQEKADEFYNTYTGTVSDIASYEQNADYQKAEEKRQQLVGDANSLVAKFKQLSSKFQIKLGGLKMDNKEVPTFDPETVSIDKFNQKTAEKMADEFYARYTTSIDEIVSYQENPDLKKAELKREELIAEASTLAAKFQEMATKLQAALGRLKGNIPEPGKPPAK